MRTTALAAKPHSPQARRSHPRVVTPSLHRASTAAGSVFGAVRLRGPIGRDAIAEETSLSIATVNRQVSALLAADVLRERPDLAVSGAIGRPRIPVEVNGEPFLTLGIHIGARTTSMVATDLLGRTLDAVEIPTPAGGQHAALTTLADSARRYLSRWHRRQPLWVGAAIGGVVDAASGHVDHPRLGWAQAPVGPVLAGALDLPVSVAAHVDAMAGAELLLDVRQPVASRSTSLYLYARETVGYALVIDGKVHTPAGGPGTMAGLPVRSELIDGSGRLESTVSDEAVLAAARRLRIVDGAATFAGLLQAARTGSRQAAELLAERARVLGEAVALLRDLLNPDDLVVGGHAFTEYPEGMRGVQEAFARSSALAPRAIRVTAFGNRVHEVGAGVVSLGGIYADPVTALRRVRARPVMAAVADA